MNHAQIYLDKERDAAAWQAQWRKAIDSTAGVAPSLNEGTDYVKGIRQEDAKRLDRLER